MIAPGNLENRPQPRPSPPRTNSRQALVDQNAVVGVQRHHVGDSAQRHQIEQLGQIRLGPALTGEPAEVTQPCAQGQQHVEDHPDTGDALAREGTSRLVGIDDGIGRRQLVAGQVMVGDQHPHPGRLGCRDAIDAGDAVVDGDQQVGFALRGDGNDFGRQPVAVLEAIGHQIIDMRRPQLTQAEHADAARGGTVGIEVADEQDALALFQRLDQQLDRGIDALELLIRNQPRQPLVQLLRASHATGRV